ncbi:probable ATP-dependent RNA helicase CG8611 isoform X2 [Chelonus insularis]|uniref:probable ATP-dependent RNA helicase CG8611 isoform X2 n=1 Tax=Chelonus insularis TaxID=460826 RepID=UPI00158D364B|nr:probable ATP-dependent RNA helicase CG8611 isoform X2 [Chelonus insularis]
MTIENMDIQLNIFNGTTEDSQYSQLKINRELLKTFTEKADKKSRLKDNLKNTQTPIVGSGVKKRIKQKSLAAIVSKNLAKNNLKPILKGSKNIEDKTIVKVRKHEQNKVESNTDDTVNKPLVSFVKPSEIKLKTIIAKTKVNQDSKKSLTNIYSKKDNSAEQKDNDVTLLKNRVVSEESRSNSKPIANDKNFPKNKKINKKLNNTENSSASGEKLDKTFYRPSGKISSLFGNNPEIPRIGQRFVKPVHEPVFTKVDFADLGIHPYMISNLEQNMKITKATTVQQKAIPMILSESLQRIRPKLSRNDGLKALVVVPTRELVLQTYECFLKLIRSFAWIVPGYLLGGEKRKAEKARLRRGCTILVATPGRLLDHIKHTEALKMSDVKCLVLDEADRMLDMGYEKDISDIVSALNVSQSQENTTYDAMEIFRQNRRKIFTDNETGSEDHKSKIQNDDDNKTNIKEDQNKQEVDSAVNKVTSGRQTILLSATLTNAIEKLAGLTMTNPIFIDAAKENLRDVNGNANEVNEDFIIPDGVIQSYVVVPPKLKLATLCAYIIGKCQSSGHHKILIFMATQDMVDYYIDILSSVLTESEEEEDEEELEPLVDVEFFKLHGNMTQKERTEVFKTFRETRSGVLLSTDVAARGLDLPMVDSVIQFTGPISARDYVHRIGRTARAGCSGSAVIFLTPSEMEFVRMLESRRVRIKQEDMDDMLNKLIGPLSRYNSLQSAATNLQNKFENLVLNDSKLHKAACKAYLSWIRFYSSYPREMRGIFNRKDLHLGHYAKSFALRDPPQRIGGIGKKIREKNPTKVHNNRLSNERPERMKHQKPKNEGLGAEVLKRSRMLNVSEYGDGLEPVKKAKH